MLSLQNQRKQTDRIHVISNPQKVSYLNLDYQNAVTNAIKKEWKRGNYTVTKPLFVLNPYETSHLSMNVYFNSKEKSYLSYTISVDDPDIPDYTNIAFSGTEDNLTKQRSYQLIGFVQGMENKLTLELHNASR